MIGVAEVNWDDDPRYGVGDYRIPKVMLTLPDNTRVDPPKNKGNSSSTDVTNPLLVLVRAMSVKQSRLLNINID